MRTPEQIKATRQNIKDSLARVVAEYERITVEMSYLPHQRGVAHQTLDPRTGQWIVQAESGLTAEYSNSNGQRYYITISEIHKD